MPALQAGIRFGRELIVVAGGDYVAVFLAPHSLLCGRVSAASAPSSGAILFLVILEGVELIIAPLCGQQLLMIALLDDLAV